MKINWQIKLEKLRTKFKNFKIDINQMVYLAIYVAFILILTFIPYIGYITIIPISITIIPAFIAIATWHIGTLGGLTVALTFGLGAYLKAIAGGAFGVELAIFTTYPELAIVPRLAVGILIAIVVKLFGEIKIWKVVISTVLCAIFNSIFVIGWLYLIEIYSGNVIAGPLSIFLYTIYPNLITEPLVALAIGLALYYPLVYLKKAYKSKKIHFW